MVASLIGIAKTCVWIPTRRQLRRALSSFRSSYRRLACSRAFRVPMLKLGRRECEGDGERWRREKIDCVESRVQSAKETDGRYRVSARRFKESLLHRETTKEKDVSTSNVNRDEHLAGLATEYRLFRSRLYQAKECFESVSIIREEEEEESNCDNFSRLYY